MIRQSAGHSRQIVHSVAMLAAGHGFIWRNFQFSCTALRKVWGAEKHTAVTNHLARAQIPETSTKGFAMNKSDADNERVPLMQQLLDNPFLLLFLGVMVPMVVYTLWGVIDILTVPLAK
jgi:hypothetical protein